MVKPSPSSAKKSTPDAAPAADSTAPSDSLPAAESTTKVAWRRLRVTPWLFVAVAVLGVGLLVWAKLAGLIPGPGDEDPAAAAMNQRFAAIEQRIRAIEAGRDADEDARRGAAEDAAAKLDALDGRIADIEARAAVVPEQVDLGPLEDRLAALEEAYEARRKEAAGAGSAAGDLEDRIAALEARPTVENADPLPIATLLAVAQLRAALRGSGPYQAALTALEALDGGGGDDDEVVAAALAVLTPHAAAGIDTRERLRDRFTALAEAILRAVVTPPGGSWISRTLARLSGLVTVRRVGGGVAGNTAEAIVARAEARLETGDLAAAVGEVEALDGAAAEVAASWLAHARTRLAAEGALAALDARAIAAMGGG